MKISRALALTTMLALTLAGAGLAALASPTTTHSTRLTVTETEYKLTLSRRQLAAGTTTIVAVNKGKLAHSLSISGPGLKKRLFSGTIAPGSSRTTTVKLKAGSYTLWCPVDGHAGLGMKTTLKVGSGSSGSGGGTTTSGSSWG